MLGAAQEPLEAILARSQLPPVFVLSTRQPGRQDTQEVAPRGADFNMAAIDCLRYRTSSTRKTEIITA
jgi:hypothetical protein